MDKIIYIRKQFLPMERDFPFFIHKWVHTPSDKGLHYMHNRDFWKIVYVVSGTGRFDINGQNYRIDAGSVLFVRPNDLTNYEISSPRMHIYNACFLPEFVADRLKSLENNCQFFSIFNSDFVMSPELTRIFYLQDSAKSLHKLFRALLAEYRSNQVNRVEIIRAMMIELLIKLQRMGIRNFLGDKYTNMVLMVRDYIERNFAENFDFSQLAKHVDMSRSRLCTVFKNATGHCISEELLTRRLNEAHKRLRTTTQPISEICFQCGFNDISYFYRKFHERFNTTPRVLQLNFSIQIS